MTETLSTRKRINGPPRNNALFKDLSDKCTREYKPDITFIIASQKKIFDLEKNNVMGYGWRETIALIDIQVRYDGLRRMYRLVLKCCL